MELLFNFFTSSCVNIIVEKVAYKGRFRITVKATKKSKIKTKFFVEISMSGKLTLKGLKAKLKNMYASNGANK